MAKSSEKIINISEKIVTELFSKLGIEASHQISLDSEDNIQIKLESPDSGILIGYHGDNLFSLQLVLSLMINKALGEELWRKVFLDISSWKKDREEILKEMVKKAVERLGTNVVEIPLPPMSPPDRRLIHIFVQEYTDVTSESNGEGRERHVVIKKKS